MLHQWLPIALRGSRYAERLPIGNDQSIMTATPGRLRSFYKNWYRPDLQAVIAVGDFDPAVIEAQIKKHFSGLKMPANPPKRVAPTVPPNKEPLIAVASDKEATGSDIELMFKLPARKTKTVGDYRRNLMERLVHVDAESAARRDLAEARRSVSRSRGARRAISSAARRRRSRSAPTCKDGGIDRGSRRCLTEAKRVDPVRVPAVGARRAKQNLLRGYERAYAERDKTQSASFVQEYVGNYLNGEPIPGIDYEYKLAQQLVPEITLAM
jgi:zinc protease